MWYCSRTSIATPAWIDIDLLVAGPVSAAMALISRPPLEYTKRIGIKPEQTSGETMTRLRLQFPLLADLKAEEMKIDADVQLRNFGIAGVVPGIDVTRRTGTAAHRRQWACEPTGASP